MSNEKSLPYMAKGAGLLFAGMILTYIVKFIYRTIVSRYLGPSGYGLLSLGEGILNVAMLISAIGLQTGVVKFIGQYVGERNQEGIKGTIVSVFKIILPLSILISTLIIVFSQYIGIGIFNKKELVPIVVISALALPFSGFTSILTNIFIALKKIQYRNYLNSLIRPFSLLMLTIIVIIFKGNVYYIALASLTSYILSATLGFYLLEYKTISIIRSKIKGIYNYKSLLSFSSPLFFSGIFVTIMGWMDTFFLGIIKTTADVGIYNVVLPLISLLTIFISAFGSIFLPMSSELHAKKEEFQIANLYNVVSRWIFLLSFPILLITIIFSKDILRILFGSAYESGAVALQILITAYFIGAIMGPTGKTLMTFNKTKDLFCINSIAAIINFILNYLLISKYGLNGAAIATGISLFFRNGATFLIARKKLSLTYSFNIYFKYFASAIIPVPFLLIIIKYINLNFLTLPGIIFIYGSIYFILLIVFKAFTKEDLIIIEAMEKKTKISLNILKKGINMKE